MPPSSTSWSDLLLANEGGLRLGVFIATLLLMAGAEALWPRRERQLSRRQRWPGNLALVALGALCGRFILLPLGLLPVALSVWAESEGWGVFAIVGPSVPFWASLVAALLLLDLAIYIQHVVFHRWPWLWRLHRMHHADQDYDTTTGLRFHPFEIVLSAVYKGGVVIVLGPPPEAIVLFEIILNASALFNHANLRLPLALDRCLRWLLVTPDMHRVHHSVVPAETHSNFGFCFPWWDRVFITYRPAPEAGHDQMIIGLPFFRRRQDQGLWAMLCQPWRSDAPHP